MFLFLIYILHLILPSICQAAHVVVNCTWPCADSSQVCVVSATTIECRPQHNSQWVLKQPNQSPVFVGEIARWHTPCVTSPNPTLHYLSEDTAHIKANQSIIPWPPADTDRPLDSHLSDCEPSTFCDLDTGICVDRLEEDATCDSTNQCNNSLLCIQNKCTNVSLDGNEDDPPSNGTNKVHIAIIVVVVVVAVLAIASIAGIVYYRRKVRMLKSKGDPNDPFSNTITMQPIPSQQQQQQQQHPSSSAVVRNTSSASSSSAATSSSATSPPTAPAPAMIMEPTPTMQQQHLHYQLQRQHGTNDMTVPPPPYSP
ncbi:predicted protein [Lichtheimia corymbifera JMRC:FSU:9682]|uniref:Extracellular membrane protein CFEM domain-containing protein n=1 Tax=Lichtheimia corymbifera JMRC:FSU:9682 TaxID=1263082 RepID=A0A068RJB3_9FUNG|nr:predicted protein [Lichtheimia corymbifera JMRC:FSU:9682]